MIAKESQLQFSPLLLQGFLSFKGVEQHLSVLEGIFGSILLYFGNNFVSHFILSIKIKSSQQESSLVMLNPLVCFLHPTNIVSNSLQLQVL